MGFIDQVEDYSLDITNSALIKKYTATAPAVYQRCINKILNNKNNMNIENKELIEKTTSVLDKIMNFFKKVVNKQTITDKGTLHHAGEMGEGTEVYNDGDMSSPAPTDTYTTAEGKKIDVKEGQVQKVAPAPEADPEAEDEDDDVPTGKLNPAKKATEIQNRLQQLKARLHAQNALLTEARTALEEASNRLQKTHTEVKNEIKSTFTPEGSKRSNKAKPEATAFFAPQSELAKNAVKRAVAK
jgi:ATP-dependent Clp protease protease subunit